MEISFRNFLRILALRLKTLFLTFMKGIAFTLFLICGVWLQNFFSTYYQFYAPTQQLKDTGGGERQ